MSQSVHDNAAFLGVKRPRSLASRWLVGLLLAAGAPAAAQDEGFDPEGFDDGAWVDTSAQADGNRSPQLVLVDYDGTLCPSGSASFNASSDGGLTWVTSTNPQVSTVDTTGSCHLEIDIVVPPDARFRNPFFCPSIYAYMEPDALQSASQLSISYTLREGSDPEGRILGGENQPETIEPRRDQGFDGDYDQAFCKLVNVTTPECRDPSQESVFRLQVDMHSVVRPGTYLQLSTIDAEFNEGLGASWGTCAGF